MDTPEESSTSDDLRKSRRLQFDEANIGKTTCQSATKDYGLLIVPEAKTPFPRFLNPVNAGQLAKSLNEVLSARESVMHSHSIHLSDSSSDSMMHFSINAEQSMPWNLGIYEKERRHLEFLKKRKQFYMSEFLVTQQKRLNCKMHPPGPSIGNNWRIEDGRVTPSYKSISRVRTTSAISRSRLSQFISDENLFPNEND